MSLQSKSPRKTVTSAKTELSLRVSCGAWLLAIDADHVVHVALIDDVATQFQSLGSAQTGALGTLAFNGKHYAAFDLYELLGLAGEAHAWVLLRIPAGPDGWLSVALRTGSCRTVGRASKVQAVRLPQALCAVNALFRAAFVPNQAESGSARDVACGLVLDVSRLLTPAQAALARELVARRKSAA